MEKVDLNHVLFGIDLEAAQELAKREGLPPYRATQILEWIYKKNIESFQEASNLPTATRQRLSTEYRLHALSLVEEKASANGESVKYLFRTIDGELVESVLIEQQKRKTVCVSTQLGCKIGCIFCASGKGKFGRDLSAGEIVEQVAWIQKMKAGAVTNVVFMGMGEPLDNFDETMRALDILQAPWGLAMGPRRITVSTSGITPRILDFVKHVGGRVRLSVSLHASDDAKRSRLVPINRKYGLGELKKTLAKVHHSLKRQITFEYTLIDEVNDSREDAEGVARIAKPLHAKVNIIPYNPIEEEAFRTPTDEKIAMFRRVFHEHGIRVTIRKTAGRDIDAACGQLRLNRKDSERRAKDG